MTEHIMEDEMIFINLYKNLLVEEKGAVSVITAVILFFVLIGVAALAIDIGRTATTKNELQNIADAAALAGATELGMQHRAKNYPIDKDKVTNEAIKVVAANVVAGNKFSEDQWKNNVEIEIGFWLDGEFSNYPKLFLTKENAVRVTLSLSNFDGLINNFFAQGEGISRVSAKATAALTGAGKIDEGKSIPVGISKYWFEYFGNAACDQNIKFYPTNTIEGCAGWNTYKETPANASRLRDILENLDERSPEITIGDKLVFIGGTVSSAIDHPTHFDFKQLYEENKDDDGEWLTNVVVYDRDDCSNPNEALTILGFATTRVFNVTGSPDHVVEATLVCEEYVEAKGGGGIYGTYGVIPNLVE